MGYDLDQLNEGPRFGKRAKRRRINRILNILIGVVVVLIIFFGWKLLFSSNQEAAQDESTIMDTKQPAETQAVTAEPEETEDENTAAEEKKAAEEDQAVEESESTPISESNEHETVTDGEAESNTIRSIENSAWKPIGTEQAEPHTVNYDQGTTDRLEMEKAISYALGIDQSELTVWWLARSGDNKVAATIATKDQQHIYRVHIDWVEKNGWKPVRVDELKENDSPAYKKPNTSSSEEETDED